MQEHEQKEEEFSLKKFFVPLTTLKVIHFIIFIGLIVFGNMLFNNFVWDDKTYIIQNLDVHTFNLYSLFSHNMFNSIGQYRPIPALYFAALYSFFKSNQFFYHFSQLLLHIINTILVYKLFTKFFNKGISFVSSIFFLIHPLQIESVSFISAAISPLFFFFGISALLLSLKEIQTKKVIFLIFFLLLSSLLTKETGILFLIMIIFYKVIFNKKSVLLYFCLGFITVCVYFLIRFFVGNVGFYRLVLIPIARLSLQQRLINMPAIMYYYVSNLFFPDKLSHNQLWIITSINFANVYFPLIVDLFFSFCVALLGFIIFKKSKQIFKIYSFFLFWFVVGLSAHLQIIPLDETVADRWFYFPFVGIIGIFASLAWAYKLFIQKYFKVALTVTVGVIILLSLRTIVRNTNWVDGVTLYTHDMKISNNFDIEDNLGVEYFDQGNFEQAKNHFENSYKLFPYEVNAYNTALTYVQLGNFKKAEEYYDKSLQANDYAQTTHKHELGNYETYIRLLLQLKQYNKVIEVTKNGIMDYPDASDLWMSLAFANNEQDNKQEALTDAKKALSFDPNNQTASTLYDNILHSKPIYINPLK